MDSRRGPLSAITRSADEGQGGEPDEAPIAALRMERDGARGERREAEQRLQRRRAAQPEKASPGPASASSAGHAAG
jgi:hypothetical protein